MRPTPRPLPPLRHAAALAGLVFCAALIVCLLWPIHRIVLQAVALVVIFAAFCSCPPVKNWLTRMSAFHRTAFFVLLAAVVVGHFSLTTRKYYPFVAWGIFSAVSEKSPVLCRELIGTTAQGKSVRLLVEQLFPSIIQFDLPPVDEPQKTDDLARALAEAYNERHAADPVRQVDLMLMAVELHPSSRESRGQPSCELLQRYDISSGR
jgi:hypothetical protein